MSSAIPVRITKSVKSNSRIRRMRGRRKRKSDAPQQHSLLQLQQQFGNQAVGRMIQAKLTIGKPDNHYEREADQVADKVMRMPEPVRHGDEETTVQTKPLANQITPLVQRVPEEQPEEDESLVQAMPEESSGKDEGEQMIAANPLVQRQAQAGENEEEEALQAKLAIQRQEIEEEEEPVQAKQASGLSMQNAKFAPGRFASTNPIIQRVCGECEEEMQRQPSLQPKGVRGQSPQLSPSVAANIQSLNGGGNPLPRTTRSFFEPRFGADFSKVRIHTGLLAAETSRALNARAFTIGRTVSFGSGEFSPETPEGRRLLAHELTHVVQQNGGHRGTTGRSLAGRPLSSNPMTSINAQIQCQGDMLKTDNILDPTLLAKIKFLGPFWKSGLQLGSKTGRFSLGKIGKNADYPNTYINKVRVGIGNPGWMAFEWETKRPTIIGVRNLLTLPRGPYIISPGKGKCVWNCNDNYTSQQGGTNCTPKGGSWPVANNRRKRLLSTRWAKWPTYFQRPTIAIHTAPPNKLPDYPASHGCVRTEEEGAKIVRDNTIEGKSIVEVGGAWPRPPSCRGRLRRKKQRRR